MATWWPWPVLYLGTAWAQPMLLYCIPYLHRCLHIYTGVESFRKCYMVTLCPRPVPYLGTAWAQPVLLYCIPYLHRCWVTEKVLHGHYDPGQSRTWGQLGLSLCCCIVYHATQVLSHWESATWSLWPRPVPYLRTAWAKPMLLYCIPYYTDVESSRKISAGSEMELLMHTYLSCCFCTFTNWGGLNSQKK